MAQDQLEIFGFNNNIVKILFSYKESIENKRLIDLKKCLSIYSFIKISTDVLLNNRCCRNKNKNLIILDKRKFYAEINHFVIYLIDFPQQSFFFEHDLQFLL